jgi:hypothetical protein
MTKVFFAVIIALRCQKLVSMSDIDATRAESEQCYRDAFGHGVGREERAKLLKTAM